MLKSKLLLFISLFIIVSDILFVCVNYFSTLNSLDSDTKKWAEDQQHIFNLLIEEKATNMQQLSTYVANNINVQNLFLHGKEQLESEGGDYSSPVVQLMRDKLYDLVKASWAEMTSNYDVRQLHFHLGPGSNSYLRVHRPEKFGDILDDVRYTIVDANRLLLPTKGFETGRVYSGIRGAVPVYATNTSGERIHVGALEAGTSFAGTLNLLKDELKSNIAVLLTSSHVTGKMWPNFITEHFIQDLAIDGYYIESSTMVDVKKIMEQPAVFSVIRDSPKYDIIHSGGVWQLCSFPLRDYRGNQNPSLPDVGVVVIWRDASKQWGLVRQSLTTNIILAIITLVLVELILIVGWHFSHRYLNAIISNQTSELEKLANYDGLTGIFNRRGIEEILQRETNRVDRYDTFLTVILLDLDRFKRINDTFGHNTGDDVLKNTAQRLQTILRKSDHVGRWGGEEFLIIAPDTNLDRGVLQAERIRKEIETCEFGQVGTVTVSVGIGQYKQGEKPNQLFKRIDDALYRAKQKGRNLVDVAG